MVDELALNRGIRVTKSLIFGFDFEEQSYLYQPREEGREEG